MNSTATTLGTFFVCVFTWMGIVCAPAHSAERGAKLADIAAETPAVHIRIVYPPDGAPNPGLEKLFVFGSVRPPTARVLVNGFDTPMVRTSNGAWLGVIPIQPGPFNITVTAFLPDGSESGSVVHRLKRPKEVMPVRSKSGHRDTKVITVLPEERFWKPPRVAQIADDTVFLRSGPDNGPEQAGYELRLNRGVLVTVVGQIENSLHVKLSDIESVWVEEKAVNLLPKNTPRPVSYVQAWTVLRRPKSTVIQATVNNSLPYRVEPSLDGMSLTLKIYGAMSNTDWIHYASADPWIRVARWSHPMREVYELELALKQPVWGYRVSYENQKIVLELRDPPAAPPPSTFSSRRRVVAPPLEGVRICVDPGHPPMGATGPLGEPEHAVNWALAGKLKDALEARGAEVILTRVENETVPLPARVDRAVAADADLFISLHTNALAPSEDPFQKNGFSVYYFNSFSASLAADVHSAFVEEIPLRDDGLHFGNLHVVRQTYMPAILVENGFLIWPPEEELLLKPDFQNQCALATAKGIETFLKNRWAGR